MKYQLDNSSRFWDKIAERYSKRPVVDNASYQKKLEITRQYFNPQMQVLEIGCGTGSTAIAHAPFVKHIRAFDISSKMIEIARSNANEEKIENVTFQQSSVDNIQLSAGSLDAVLGLSILHLLENREEVIAKVYHWLKPNGVFVSSTMCLRDAMKYLKHLLPVGKLFGLTPYVSIFTEDELMNNIKHAGFEIDYHWRPDNRKASFIVAKRL